MRSASISPVWVGFADFGWQLASTFLILFLLMLANFSQQESLGADCAKSLKEAIAKEASFPNVTVTENCTVVFEDPDNQFATGSSELTRRFMRDLDQFIPIYVQVLNSPQFKDRVQEIHVDGHTSSVWNIHSSARDSHWKNMELSNYRSLNTMLYVLDHALLQPNIEWYRSHIVNNGYGSSRPRMEDATDRTNQRVEFKVVFSEAR